MKKLAKIIAAMTVAVAAFALVGCAEGVTVGQDFKWPEPEEPAAAAEAPKAETYYFNYSVSNLDDAEKVEDYVSTIGYDPSTIRRVVTTIPAAEEGADPTYRLSYTIEGYIHTVNQWKVLAEIDIVDNTTSIDVTDRFGTTWTYKPAAVLKDGTYELQSKTTNLLGSSVAAPKIETVSKDDTNLTKWNAIPAGEKTATITVIEATTTTPAVTKISWTDFEGNELTEVPQTSLEGSRCVFSVDGDTVTFTCGDEVDTNNDGDSDTPVVYTYTFKKAAN